MQSDDLDAQKELADKLPEIADFLESMREKVREELAPYSSPEVIKAFEKKMENFDKDLQLTGEKVSPHFIFNSIEFHIFQKAQIT